MTEPIRIPVVLTRGGITGQAQAHGDLFYTDLHDDHIRAIMERSEALGLLPSVVKDSLTTQHAAPADDEATVLALMRVGLPGAMIYHLSERHAIAMSAAIRQGEVPGLTTLDKCSDLINEHARAMNERDTQSKLKDLWYGKCMEARAAHAELVNLLPATKTALDRGFNAEEDVYRRDHNDMVDLLCAIEAAIVKHQNKDASK